MMQNSSLFFVQNQNEVIIFVESKIDETIFFPVGQRLPVWVGGGGHKEGVHLQQKKYIFLVSQNNGQGLCSKMCFLHFLNCSKV